MRSDSTRAGVRTVADIRDAVLAKARDREGRLRVQGEVLDYRETQDGHWATLLDSQRSETLEVFFRRSDQALERGSMVSVEGKLKATKRLGEATIQFRLMGDTCSVMHPARRHLARKSHIEQLCIDLTERRKLFTAAPIEHFWIVCGARSQASADVKRRFFGHKSRARFVECSITDAANIAQAIHETVARAGSKDALLLARSGGTAFELDVFNDHRIATALASATRRVPTLLALGHASDALLIRPLVSEVSESPLQAGKRMAELCHTDTKPSPRGLQAQESARKHVVRRLLQSIAMAPGLASGNRARISALWAPLLFAVGALVGWLAHPPLRAASRFAAPHASAAPAAAPASPSTTANEHPSQLAQRNPR